MISSTLTAKAPSLHKSASVAASTKWPTAFGTFREVIALCDSRASMHPDS